MCKTCVNNCIENICCSIGLLRCMASNSIRDTGFYLEAMSRKTCGIRIYTCSQKGGASAPINFDMTDASIGFCPNFCRCDLPKSICAENMTVDLDGCCFVTTVKVKINCNNCQIHEMYC